MTSAFHTGYVSMPCRARLFAVSWLVVIVLGLCEVANAEITQVLRGHLPSVSARGQSLGRMEAGREMKLAIGLPLRNREGLTHLIEQIYDPASPQYGRYLTADQFTEAFGPLSQDYESAVNYARSNGLRIIGTHPNRMLVEVEGTVAQVEHAFGVKMHWYQHPVENRVYFAPSVEPSVRLETPVLRVNGLDDYSVPHPLYQRSSTVRQEAGATPQAGSGPSGTYMGLDFRNAYAPDVTLTGAGQTVGLFQLDGYYAADITNYATKAGMANIPPLQNVLVGGFNGIPQKQSAANEEVALDIEMSISMAPGLSRVLVYEGAPGGGIDVVNAVLNRMATDNLARQLSCSWMFEIDALTEQIFLQYAAQGQSFFLASGDSGAYAGAVMEPSDSPYITVVGGTVLTTEASGSWLSETAWSGSGGGISAVFPIPAWQLGVATAANHGSASMRNFPDVAMVAHNVEIYADNGSSLAVDGTSIAAPLWAAFTALVNERAATLGQPPVGFLNPTLYAIGKSATLTNSFHDITSGNNHSTASPNLYPATTGYDLCTGWGAPQGMSLINALLRMPDEPLVISSPMGFIATGAAGGPFSVLTQTFELTNTGTATLNWSVVNTSSWLNVSLSSGQLASGDPSATVTVSLTSSANDLPIGEYSATVAFLDSTSGITQARQFTLLVGNGGFETADFTNWIFSGQLDVNFALSIDYSLFTTPPLIPGIADSAFVHSGLYGAFLGQNTTLGSLSQQVPTKAGQSYVVSFWLSNPTNGVPNEFVASWNGNVLYDGVDLAAFAWTNLQFVVTAANTSSILRFRFRNDQNAFGLDDVSLQPLVLPTIQDAQMRTNGLSFAWNTMPGVTYKAQYAENLGSPLVWIDLGNPIKATGGVLSASDSMRASQRFYRVVIP